MAQSVPSHLDGVNEVLDQEKASQFSDGLVEFGQNHVAVLVDHVFRQSHLLLQVLPERKSRGDVLMRIMCSQMRLSKKASFSQTAGE